MTTLLQAVVIFFVCVELCSARIYHGCFQDKQDRHLETKIATGTMTIEKCIQLCSYRGTFYAGVEYGKQCFCGNHIKPDYTKYADSDCSTPCTGDASQKCGATWKVSIYSTHEYKGCYVDMKTRILEGPSTSSDKMTTDMCLNFCRNANKVFALTQYSTQCYCGNDLKPYPKKPDSECSYECKGAKTELCGGFWRGSLYRV